MSTDNFTPIIIGADNHPDTVNNPLAQLDAAIGDLDNIGAINHTSIVAALGGATLGTVDKSTFAGAINELYAELFTGRGIYSNIDARFDSIIAAGGNVATLTNGAASAGQKIVIVDSSVGFIAGARVGYARAGGAIEYNVIDTVNSGVSITLITNIGTGGIANNAYFSMISEAEYQAAQSINAASSGVSRTLPNALAWAGADKFNVMAYGATGGGSADDAPAIQAAINAAEANGSGIVEIPPGTYKVGVAITVDSPNVSIIGVGRPTLVAMATFDAELLDPEPGVIFIQDTDHVYVAGIIVEAGNAISSNGIMLRNSDHCVISRCRVEGTVTTTTQTGAGIGIYGDAKYNRVEYCDVIDVAYSGLNIARDDTPSSLPPVGNVLFANYVENPGYDGIDLYQHYHTICAYNRVVGAGRYGINPTGGTASFPNIDHLFIGNYVSGGALIGIYLTGYCYRCRVIGNTVVSNTTQGIAVNDDSGSGSNLDCIVANNICFDNGENGISVGSPRCIVEGNQCIENGTTASHNGINVFGVGDKSIIKGNVCKQNTGSGIILNTVDQVMVEGNYCELNTQYGIEILTGISHMVKGNYVLDNAEHGIYLNDASRNMIHDNYSSGNGTAVTLTYNNIHLAGNSDNNSIQGNRCFYGYGTPKSLTGITIAAATCNDNWIANNDLDQGGNNLAIADSGTNTMITPENRDVTRPVSGSWTPGITFGGGTTGMTFGTQNGTWKRVGNTIVARGYIALTAKGSSTGTALITGLPYAAANVANNFYPATLRVHNLTGVSGQVQGYVSPNAQTIALSFSGTGSATTMTDAHFTATADLIIEITYGIA